jgi:DNA-binding XRE family transcriptional regulator
MEDIRKEYQGKKLRAKREAFFMTQPELAEKIGVSVTTVNLWENNNARASLKHLKALKEFFEGVSQPAK